MHVVFEYLGSLGCASEGGKKKCTSLVMDNKLVMKIISYMDERN